VCFVLQSTSQGALVEQQQARLSDLESSVRQWESRCADLRDLVTGHEARCKEAAAEVMKGNDIIEKLQVRCCSSLGVCRWGGGLCHMPGMLGGKRAVK
jgi:hypothetical protein